MEAQETSSLNLLGIVQRVQSRRWLVLLSLFSCWALATAVGRFLPAKYRSETVILIEQQRVPTHYVEPNVAVDLQERLQTMSQQILSRIRLLGIIDKFHLYAGFRPRLDSDALVDRMRQDIGIDLVRTPGRDGELSAFKISYSASTPALAQQVTSELTSMFIEENLRNREQLSTDTTAFLEAQLSEARKSLDQQEQRLREFKSRYLGRLPEQMQANVQILGELQGRLQAANDALTQTGQRRNYLESLLSHYRAIAPVVTSDGKTTSVAGGDINARLTSLRAQLAELNSKYTPLHPDVIRLKSEIADAEKLQAQQLAQRDKASDKKPDSNQPNLASATVTEPVLQIESQLKTNEYEAQNRRTEIKRLEAQISDYEARLNLEPAVEQQLAAITRDHDQSRLYYESLLSKKQQSEMATDLERRQQGEQFRMIDPPSLPQKPYFPNRLYCSLAGIALGLACGIGIVFLLEIVNPKIYGEQELSAAVRVPIVTTIPSVRSEKEERKKAYRFVLEGIAAGVLLLIIPLATYVVSMRD